MEQDDQIKLMIDEPREDSDKFLARLTFDHLSLANKARFCLGLLSTLYVAVEPKSSRTSLSSN
jgi:hypothetical protein